MITSNIPYLTQTNVWSTEIKEAVNDELMGRSFVRWIPFANGDTLNIPSIGEGTVRNYVEDTAAVYDSMDTGNFSFRITDYTQSGTYITDKARQDLLYAAELESSFVPKQIRAMDEYLETHIFRMAGGQASANTIFGGQIAANNNAINGADHRWVALGTDLGTNENPISLKDFAKALFALKRANMPGTRLMAIVDPSVEYTINTMTNLVNIGTAEPLWGDLITSGIGSGPRFVRNIYGFDVYVSNYLPVAGANGAAGGAAATEAITASNGDADTISAYGVCNIFMSAADQKLVPFIGAWRQEPRTESKRNMDFQRTEYLTTSRFGTKVYRPENLVVVLTSTNVIE